jgi:predicted DNA-binding transcriptional regulator YafY
MFALDAIEEAALIKDPAKVVAKKLIEELVGRDFGIYSGEKRKLAKLQFTAKQAPWVRSETWHKDQKGESTADGGFLLTVPYSDPRELVLEILRYGPDVRVIEPADLQQEVAQRLRAAADQYA